MEQRAKKLIERVKQETGETDPNELIYHIYAMFTEESPDQSRLLDEVEKQLGIVRADG